MPAKALTTARRRLIDRLSVRLPSGTYIPEWSSEGQRREQTSERRRQYYSDDPRLSDILRRIAKL